ncbi:conserved hypothetical protein [Ferrimonas balearica DSM 9799]|uniref:DUF406 family protein n=1 Tax=Ferrimonas balearica (strain DSM 9799 / CCM 4581 / KCTC 23876 / PAT) TaxID=550540 RepID=E1SWE6_FERBD|nr:YfcZ/YiiS family protein [Ferrimonas balearica]MBY6016905.1 YfcZ/YiiS family protein [Halomonas denitrificans]ADN76428.1 conserved hypothetical protein [Ferrimonas balearica DSM 9799]MBW3139329.1 YfcZ/YiiS family protein [Ferrimonas balearica]MBW3163081.1 YfcZ/YiiS family protein [Ferrimonas balearica]MBY5980774.1 YfcZ/YiiS family protein [Ferrimonas balearica]
MESKTQDLITECCGAYMDVGAVISEEDTVLSLPITAASEADARAEFEKLEAAAKARFADVQTDAQWQQETGTLQARLVFSCAAERLIFEMQLN